MPNILLPERPQMRFAPVEDDGDELSQTTNPDDAPWDLHAEVNLNEVDAFLDDALNELNTNQKYS